MTAIQARAYAPGLSAGEILSRAKSLNLVEDSEQPTTRKSDPEQPARQPVVWSHEGP